MATPLTLMDIARAEKADLALTAIQLEIANTGSVFNWLPFRTKDVWEWSSDYTLATSRSQFRAINEELGEGDYSRGSINFGMSILGDTIKIDRILKRRGEGQHAYDLAMLEKAAGIGYQYNASFIKGSSLDDVRNFDGLQRLFETQMEAEQTMDTGNVAGAALTLDILDEAMDRLFGPAHAIVMSANMARKFTAAARNASIGALIENTEDRFGTPITKYNGIPIVVINDTRNADTILPYNEVSPIAGGNATDSTSIYILNLGERGFYGAQQFDPKLTGAAQIPGSVFLAGDIEWTASLGVDDPKAGVRIGGINNVAIA